MWRRFGIGGLEWWRRGWVPFRIGVLWVGERVASGKPDRALFLETKEFLGFGGDFGWVGDGLKSPPNGKSSTVCGFNRLEMRNRRLAINLDANCRQVTRCLDQLPPLIKPELHALAVLRATV